MASLVIHLPSGPVTHPLENFPVAIGRTAGNDIVIPDASISSRHALMTEKGELMLLRDLDSTNHTWVDDEEISLAVLGGDCPLRFGSIRAEFRSSSGSSKDEFALKQRQLDELGAECERLRSERRGLVEAETALRARLSDTDKQTGELRKELEAISARHRGLEAAAQELEKATAEKQSASEAMRAELSAAREQLSELPKLQQQLAQVEAAAASQREKAAALEKQLGDSKAKGSAAALELESVARKAADFQARFEAAHREFKALSEHHKALQTERDLLKQERDRGAAELGAARAQIEEQRAAAETVPALRAQIEELQKRSQQAEAEKVELQKTADDIRGECNRLAHELSATAAEKSAIQTRHAQQFAEAEQSLGAAQLQRDEARGAWEKTAASLREAEHELGQQRSTHDLARQHLCELEAQLETNTALLHDAVKTRDEAIASRQSIEERASTLEIAREQLLARIKQLEQELEHSRGEIHSLKGQQFALAMERDTLKTEVAALVEQRNASREIAQQLAEAERTIEHLQAAERETLRQLERARSTEQEMLGLLAEAPRLVSWLQGAAQRLQLGELGAATPSKIVSIDSGKEAPGGSSSPASLR